MLDYLIKLLKIDFYEYCVNISIKEWIICLFCSFGAILLISKYYWRREISCIRSVIFALVITFVLAITLLGRENGMESSSLHTLFLTYERAFIEGALHVACEILFNALLFLPIGGCLFGVIPGKLIVRDIILFSLLVEILQLITGRGVFELADIINNVLGGIVGVLSMSILNKCRYYRGKTKCLKKKLY